MAEESKWWENYGGYVKFGSAILGVAAAGVGSWHLRETEPSATPAIYDMRVQQAAQDLKAIETEARALNVRVQGNSEEIAKLKAEMADLQHLGDERKERFLTLEAETHQLARRQEDILDRLRAVENKHR